MATTLAQARSDLFAFFFSGGAPTIANVVVALDYEPPRDEITAPVTLTVSSFGVTTKSWRAAVRIYVKVSGSAEIAQDLIETVLMDVDHAVDSRYGESEWRIRLLEADGLLQAECIYERGREDI